MKLQLKIATVLGALALAVVPAMALATQPADPGQGNGNGPHYTPAPPVPGTPGPSAGLPAKAKAYGVYCQGESKKHVAGAKGTAFSQCVTAMAKAANDGTLNPRKACVGMSKKHVKGEKGTAFSRCVKAAAKLHRDQGDASGS
jgi:hypothetical protein